MNQENIQEMKPLAPIQIWELINSSLRILEVVLAIKKDEELKTIFYKLISFNNRYYDKIK